MTVRNDQLQVTLVRVITESKQSPYADYMHRLQQSFTAAYQRIDEEC